MDIAYTRKYRPTLMRDYLGEDLKARVKNRLKDEKNFPQVILAYGTRGTGKTTLLRLMSKEYLCLDRQNGCACGKCDICQEIDEELINAEFGASTLGVTEVNVGTDGGKADIEKLIEDMREQPVYGYKYRVFILDECHMLTRNAQNSLLKILEEPPKHLILMLATTDPDKLLGTIRDRCQLRLQMKPATVEDLVARMLYICQQEKITTSKEALQMIAKACKKNPRDCLMTLENVAKNFDHMVTIENVMKERGQAETELYARYLFNSSVTDGSPIENVLLFLNELEEKGITYRDFMSGFTEFIMDCMAVKYNIGIEDMTHEIGAKAKKLFETYSIEDLDCLLQILEYANKQIVADEAMAKLTMLNTAMRISKVKLLSIGLQNVEFETVKQVNAGTKKAAEVYKEELEKGKIRAVSVDDAMLASVFGREVKEVTPGANVALVKEQDNTGGSDEVSIGDEEMLKMFGYSNK